MRSSFHCTHWLASIAGLLAFLDPSPVPAGTEIEAAPGKDKIVAPAVSTLPPGMITLGGEVSSHLSSGYVDSIVPFWDPGGVVLALNTRTTLNSDDQTLNSYGLIGRYLVPDHEVIIGGNAYYDSIHSLSGNDFDQLGLGAEILTHWVDARFNYYLPEDTRQAVDKHSSDRSDSNLGPVFRNRVAPNVLFLQQQRFTHSRRTTTRTYEAAVEGWNAEVGFLVPGLDKYFELRFFAGAYHYDNPFGSDFTGFKARAEARILPGLIANVEYWDDAYLTGGHWTGELAVSVPFSIFNLAQGRNPFEGTAEMFQPRQREFRERLSHRVIRSHRVMTVTGSDTTVTENSVAPTATEGSILLKPLVKTAAAGPPPPPQIGQGEG